MTEPEISVYNKFILELVKENIVCACVCVEQAWIGLVRSLLLVFILHVL